MTIATSLQEKKLQDCVESDTIRVISGAAARRTVYLIYICVIASTAGILYLFPTTVIITGFIVLQVLLLASLYPLVKFAIMTEDHDLVWDQDGVHWLKISDIVQVNEYSKVTRVATVGPQVAGTAQEVIMDSYAISVHVNNDRVAVLVGTTLTSRADTTTTVAGENTVRQSGTDIHQEVPHKEVTVVAATPTVIVQDLRPGRTAVIIVVHVLALQHQGTLVRQTVLPLIHPRAVVSTTVP
ncbi:hypothetical protein TELCIR_18075 [Teladorsagia circumcincta]|uniref:Uncharacterized protein n=1 Tax=Teladorsagia circumcincta TaxID=45464 RepID=A0A2G9TR67_TELCI|nr:hypothetical protein TELCIR_18075 [Teladorsagia circumcincta]